MSLLSLILLIVVLIVGLWAIGKFIPEGRPKQVLYLVIVIIIILWLLQAFGILALLTGTRVGR
jgi:hypothetical protein